MYTSKKILLPVLLVSIVSFNGLSAQKKKKETGSGYRFSIEKQIEATPVKDQHRSGTCWCFASTSFIEAELLRTGHAGMSYRKVNRRNCSMISPPRGRSGRLPRN